MERLVRDVNNTDLSNLSSTKLKGYMDTIQKFYDNNYPSDNINFDKDIKSGKDDYVSIACEKLNDDQKNSPFPF